MRAGWIASRWLDSGGALTTAPVLLSRESYLDLAPEIIDRALTGHFVVNGRGETRECAGFIEYHRGAATFPWRSQAAWIGVQIAGRLGIDKGHAMEAARATFRTDLYRQHLGDAGAILPGASEKIEGGIAEGTAVATENGRLILCENRFFDGRVFDPVA